jgi:hypothetical protein
VLQIIIVANGINQFRTTSRRSFWTSRWGKHSQSLKVIQIFKSVHGTDQIKPPRCTAQPRELFPTHTLGTQTDNIPPLGTTYRSCTTNPCHPGQLTDPPTTPTTKLPIGLSGCCEALTIKHRTQGAPGQGLMFANTSASVMPIKNLISGCLLGFRRETFNPKSAANEFAYASSCDCQPTKLLAWKTNSPCRKFLVG